MDATESDQTTQCYAGPAPVVRAVTVIIGTVVGLTFVFGFGNVFNLALRLSVPVWIAPLVAPAVDLSILGLLLGTRHLALAGASVSQLRPARRLLVFASVVTLALNVADPIVTGEYGKAAFDTLGPLLLIGWAEVGPDLLRAFAEIAGSATAADLGPAVAVDAGRGGERVMVDPSVARRRTVHRFGSDDLLRCARRADECHREIHLRPISAETLRKELKIGAKRSRELVTVLREELRHDITGVTQILGSYAGPGTHGRSMSDTNAMVRSTLGSPVQQPAG
jgi:hypothetical protein